MLGWGSTYGPIGAGVRRVRKAGYQVAQAHLRHLNPFPPDLGEVLSRYDKVLIPEMNLGQLALLIRAQYLVDAVGYNQVHGMPFKAAELAEAIGNLIAEAEGIEVDLADHPADHPSPSPVERLHEPTNHRRSASLMSTTDLPLPVHRTGIESVPTLDDAPSRRPARTSPPTRRSAGAPAAVTTRSSPPSRASCPTSACAARTSSSSPASAARRASRTT